MLAVSLDGRLAPPQGGAAQLGGPGDRRVLEEALVWADACLIGAGTLRAHRCTALIRDQDLLEQRLSAGRSAQPAAVVVSRGHAFPIEWRFFQQPLERWLLAPSAVERGFDRWIPLGQSWDKRLLTLSSLGVQHLVLLGGSRLAADLLKEDAVEELQLTLVPSLLGGVHSWLPQDAHALPGSLGSPRSWRLDEVRPLPGDELLTRYRRIR